MRVERALDISYMASQVVLTNEFRKKYAVRTPEGQYSVFVALDEFQPNMKHSLFGDFDKTGIVNVIDISNNKKAVNVNVIESRIIVASKAKELVGK